MKILELFERTVTRDIAPVVYFHDQSAAKLKEEVDEYIITGGHAPGDHRVKRMKEGLHEEFVHLLSTLRSEKAKDGGPELPASWISGFYGSGKSSFAKLLGLALDGRTLPDGTPLSEALLARDRSPRAHELRDAWEGLTSELKPKPISIVFDIGSVARDDEHIHSAVVRQLQARLGYCSRSNVVAEFELKLELDGEWDRFLEAAKRTLGQDWFDLKDQHQADEHFSHVMHALNAERYPEPTSWLDSRYGHAGGSVSESVDAIAKMIERREHGRTLFIVVDEVSQYIHDNENRMLKLQSFVSELGQRMRGDAWLLVTGQQKLEEAAGSEVLGKLKDRFPAKLRVHLAPANIRDVVHRRLLHKNDAGSSVLRELFDRHRTDLKLYAYDCEEISAEDFIEVYPMLPNQIDLLLRITSNLRNRSTRAQGDTHAIRGLLQLLGELFRAQKLAEAEVGRLVTLDAIYEVLRTALDSDTQSTMVRIMDFSTKSSDALASRCAKAVALLELIQDDEPTTPELIARSLYETVGQGNQLPAVNAALERLRTANLVGYSEKYGYKIQSSAGQEWESEREKIIVPRQDRSRVIQQALKELLVDVERPKRGTQPFPWKAIYSDQAHENDVRILDPKEEPTVMVDFRYVAADQRDSDAWTVRSAESTFENRLLWVAGEPGEADELAKRLEQSRRMIAKYKKVRTSLTAERQRLLLQEETDAEELWSKVKKRVAAAFMNGSFYFRGRPISPADSGGGFGVALHSAANDTLPKLYPHFVDIRVTDTELNQLLEQHLSGTTAKFMEGGLGILSLDAGKYHATCEGDVPRRVLAYVEQDAQGVHGAALLSKFGGPPTGYSADVIRACVAGLLRGGKIRIHPEAGRPMTSVMDVGVKDLFRLDRSFRRAVIKPHANPAITARDRGSICRFFEERLGVPPMERENDAIADAVFNHFKSLRERLRQMEERLNRVPGRPALPPVLEKFRVALEQCAGSRQVEEIVTEVKQQLDALRDGVDALIRLEAELTNESIDLLASVERARRHQLPQLEEIEEASDLTDAKSSVDACMTSERPWQLAADTAGAVEKIGAQYVSVRRTLLGEQEKRAEDARGRLKRRDGFDRLTQDQVSRVLLPLRDALWDTTEDAISPSLSALRGEFAGRLAAAEAIAGDLLDEELEKIIRKVVVKVDPKIRGQEVTSPEQLEALFERIREEVAGYLKDKKRVRFI